MSGYVRSRVVAEGVGRQLAEYQELLELEAAGGIYGAAVKTLEGFREAVDDHGELLNHPTAIVLIVEPIVAPPGP